MLYKENDNLLRSMIEFKEAMKDFDFALKNFMDSQKKLTEKVADLIEKKKDDSGLCYYPNCYEREKFHIDGKWVCYDHMEYLKTKNA